ncbi:MAG: GTP pyrophosphokinase family protein [Acutalibacteraceae bacterium]|nr:GTP pyrophosphokinase family protein [Acutalibacteraceae bacterium]
MENIDREVPFFGTSIPQNVESNLFTKQISEYLNKNSITTIQQDLGQVQALMSSYRCAILEVETKFRVLNEQFSLQHERNPIDSIKTRLKTPESILEKLKRKNLPITLKSIEQEINDVAGIKIICSFVDDIYMLAECLLQQDDIRLIKRKDYIKDPKLNGYRSLHLIVEIPIFLQNEKRLMKVEVQLRTIAMEFWANLEHKLRYKKSIPQETVLITSSELSECAEMSALLDRKMQKIRDLIENG